MSSVDSGEADLDKREPNLGKHQIINEEKSLVFTNRKGVPRSRRGRGYSKKEIAEAFAKIGLGNQNISKVRSYHIPVDKLRRSTHSENVKELINVLKKYLQSKKTKNKGKKQSQTKENAATSKNTK
jgi:ribosomal protein L13E